MKNKKVIFYLYCKCGAKLTNEEVIKITERYYCPQCNSEIISIGKTSCE